MIKVVLPNLKFKKQRVGKIEKLERYPMPKFDPVEWAKFSNLDFGPNYIIPEDGTMIQVLPEDKVGTTDKGDLVEDNVISIFVADSDKAEEKYQAYKEYWNRQVPTSGTAERSEDVKVANKTKNKKGKGKKG